MQRHRLRRARSVAESSPTVRWFQMKTFFAPTWKMGGSILFRLGSKKKKKVERAGAEAPIVLLRGDSANPPPLIQCLYDNRELFMASRHLRKMRRVRISAESPTQSVTLKWKTGYRGQNMFVEERVCQVVQSRIVCFSYVKTCMEFHIWPLQTSSGGNYFYSICRIFP